MPVPPIDEFSDVYDGVGDAEDSEHGGGGTDVHCIGLDVDE